MVYWGHRDARDFSPRQDAEYIQRLIWRKHALVEQMELPKLADMKQITQGQIQAMDMVIREMIQEFYI
ncbi:hypothetical protein [Paenibacillus sp. PvP052]|uniref:hypothetical protein n=1 Tax=Paenibacillus sp. PvP052 TaxID=2817853 RepID=UPI001AE4E157|nr:hypothetical protein [Paenibacillus sp. PvP052]MBP2440306.1 hypothetical protein [Paenibacillus sp. PvP052]